MKWKFQNGVHKLFQKKALSNQTKHQGLGNQRHVSMLKTYRKPIIQRCSTVHLQKVCDHRESNLIAFTNALSPGTFSIVLMIPLIWSVTVQKIEINTQFTFKLLQNLKSGDTAGNGILYLDIICRFHSLMSSS